MFYVDIKIMDENTCRKILGGDINLYERNVDRLLQKNKEVKFRMPVISKYTFNDINILKVIDFLNARNIKEIELIAEHHLGNTKYEALGKVCPDIVGVSHDDMEYCKDLFEKNGITARICSV